MSENIAFDPAEAVTFDLAYGHVHLDGAPTRVMVPAEGLVALCQAAGAQHAASLGGAIGESMGRRVAVRLAAGVADRGKVVRGARFNVVIEHLAGELAICGLGALGAERWGKAVVLLVDQSPLGDGEAADTLLADILQAALLAAIGQSTAKPSIAVVKLARDGVRVRFAVMAAEMAPSARERLAQGASWGAVLAGMHPGGPGA